MAEPEIARKTRHAGAAFGVPLLVFGLGLSLAGCGMFSKTDPRACPRAGVVDDASRLVRFEGEGRDLTDVAFQARIPQVTATCSYGGDGVEVDTKVTIIAERGPADRDRHAQFQYFVAVVGPDNAILNKKIFTDDIRFPANLTRGMVTDPLVQKIPLPAKASAADYKVLVGFQLTPDELAYNRRQEATPAIGGYGTRPIPQPSEAPPEFDPDSPSK